MPSHALRHAVNIAGDPAKVHGALTTLEGLKGWTWYRYTLSATPFSWEAKPQPVNHSDPRHIKTAD